MSSIKDTLRNNNLIFNSVWWVRRLFGITPEKLNYRYHLKRQTQLLQDYLSTHEILKLQIGAQNNPINCWLNADIIPRTDAIMYLDATRSFPISDQTFDYVYTEHMIEHISWSQGKDMLKECFRILKRGGKIRITTPNLVQLVKVFNDPTSELNLAYIESHRQKYYSEAAETDPAFMLNQMFYGYEHRFLHTEKTLSFLLSQSGFSNIKSLAIGESDDLELKHVEQHGKEIGEKFNRLESMCIEAIKV